MRVSMLLLACAVAFGACHPGPVLKRGPRQPSVGGTIAGIVRTTDAAVAVPGRKVTAIEVTRGSRYDDTTATNGGYTLKVPEGTYRLEVELRSGESLTKRPEQTRITNGDLDAGRDFVITTRLGV